MLSKWQGRQKARMMDRRRFLTSAAAGGAWSWLTTSADAISLSKHHGCRGCDPIGCLRGKKYETLVAFADAHLHVLWSRCPDECPRAVVDDVLHYLVHLPLAAQQAICLAVSGVELHSWWKRKRPFHRLSVRDRIELLNQGEVPCHCLRHKPALISWDEDYALHTAITTLATLVRIIVNSRRPARQLIGLRWSQQCMDINHLAHVGRPTYPDLTQRYDVCVIGSGAGGALVAARAAEAGKRVLIVEEGEWISPDELVDRVPDENGNIVVMPTRDDVGLMRLFQGAGFNLCGRLPDPELDRKTFDEHLNAAGHKGLTFYGKLKSHTRTPKQAINLLQARVVGGGPYINNAIHLEIDRRTWESWGTARPPGVDYVEFFQRMQEIKDELGVNVEASENYSGARTHAFVDACDSAGEHVEPLPVSILGEVNESEVVNGCAACGSDNIVDPFGQHTGGLHPLRPKGPNSYLMRAIAAGAQVAWQLRARYFQLAQATSPESCGTASQLICEDLRGRRANQTGCITSVHADQFVLAAGAIASTGIVAQTARRSCIRFKGVGAAFNANVVTPVYAVFDQPICSPPDQHAEPGIAQCYYVRRRFNDDGTEVEEPALENWFHYPGSLAIALTGWFAEYANVIRKYDHMSVCGMVVPTKVRPQNRIDGNSRVHLTIDREEFELLLSGIRKIGRIYLAAATPDNGVTIHLPTRAVLLDTCGQPVKIRSLPQLDWALNQVRCRGPQFLSLATAHPQGGNALGTVVNQETFRLQDCHQRAVDNLYLADASIFPAGCEVNPQLTLKALATYAADSLLSA